MRTSKNIASILLLLPTITFAQNVRQQSKHIDSVYTVVEQQPEFPGGMAAMGKYLHRAIRYPDSLNRDPGKLFVTFVIDKNGKVKDVQTRHSMSRTQDKSDYEKYITSIIQKMPHWKPARDKGSAVSVRYNLPIILEPE